jgi:hypothetical protein
MGVGGFELLHLLPDLQSQLDVLTLRTVDMDAMPSSIQRDRNGADLVHYFLNTLNFPVHASYLI